MFVVYIDSICEQLSNVLVWSMECWQCYSSHLISNP